MAMTALGGQAAAALDGHDLLNKARLQTERQGFVVTAERTEEDGRNLVLRGLRIILTSQNLPPIEAGDLTLEGVEQRADGSYTIERIGVPDIVIDDDENHLALRNAVIAGCQVTAKPQGQTLRELTYCRSFTMGPAEIGAAQASPLASIQRIAYAIVDQPDDSGMTFDFLAEGLAYNFEELGDVVQSEEWRKVGLSKTQGRASLKGRWSLADGRIAIDEGRVTLDGFGRLAFAFDISGYTLNAIYAMQKSVEQASLQSTVGSQKSSIAAQAAMLQMISGLAINRASLRFEDGGLTQRLLAFLAEKQNLSLTQLSAALKIAATGETSKYAPMLGQPLSDAILKAVDAYLTDHRSLTLTLTPASPVPASAILVAIQREPERLARILGISVKAND